MRHVSERVQGKNYRMFAGKPLYHHVVSTLLSCKEISNVMIDTDSDVIMGVRHKTLKVEGVQFHPESIATEFGKELLQNFLDMEGGTR